jgi:hypothetical protein
MVYRHCTRLGYAPRTTRLSLQTSHPALYKHLTRWGANERIVVALVYRHRPQCGVIERIAVVLVLKTSHPGSLLSDL